ncbi:MAG TPA: glutamate synthase-related protein [Anaerolineales bacterium]|nr:glutamate synthase-related protein [Anaerolineales bacterium]
MSVYERYHIQAEPAPNRAGHPNRFVVRVDRAKLFALLVRELIRYRGDLKVVLSRPCIYGVFSGPVGGMLPRPHMCVGCLRCTVQYPDMVRVLPNPSRSGWGESSLSADGIDTILYEASTGRVPVRGAGYRGLFGGPGWDGMWTDMSEIVRPTRDGIHGREFISTSVDLGARPDFLEFDDRGAVRGSAPCVVRLPIPFLFEAMPASIESTQLYRTLAAAAARLKSIAIVPLPYANDNILAPAPHVAPLVGTTEIDSAIGRSSAPRMAELDKWDAEAYTRLSRAWPGAVLAVRSSSVSEVGALAERGIPLVHLAADYGGRFDGRFIGEALRAVHDDLVNLRMRERLTLIVSGGIHAAEHVPKALICGADAVAIDLPLAAALQAEAVGPVTSRERAGLRLAPFPSSWGVQRVVNLIGSWRDQLLEVMGAMGLREVRRLRGEIGRAMFADELEREAFAGIEGFGVES